MGNYSAHTGENVHVKYSIIAECVPCSINMQQQRKGFTNSEGHYEFNEEIYSTVVQVRNQIIIMLTILTYHLLECRISNFKQILL